MSESVARKPSPRDRLRHLGVSDRQCEWLLSNYSLELIEQQLDWLPFRSPRKPASMIVTAIRLNYERPSILEAYENDNDGGNSSNSGDFSAVPPLDQGGS